jgi:predicted Fe-Mo cluster-binding NifX family protein
MKKFRIAIPTNGDKGLEDEVSPKLGRSTTITILDVVGGEVQKVEVLPNPAISYKFGAGPIVVKTLVDMKVDVVASSEFGRGASALLDDRKMVKVNVNPGKTVRKTVVTAIAQLS